MADRDLGRLFVGPHALGVEKVVGHGEDQGEKQHVAQAVVALRRAERIVRGHSFGGFSFYAFKVYLFSPLSSSKRPRLKNSMLGFRV